MDLSKLSIPFAPGDIEFRIQSSGESNGQPYAKVLAYVTNRAIMERLDDVCGPENWKNEFRFVRGGVLCGISVNLPYTKTVGTTVGHDTQWVVKWDGSDASDIEPFKGALSGSMKRAAVQWGIGRYLYDLDEGWAQIVPKGTKGAKYAKTKDGKPFYWLPPDLPDWALPSHLANSLPSKQALEARQANPVERKVYCTQQQQDAIRDIADELGLEGRFRVDVIRPYNVKNAKSLTPEQADQIVLSLCKRRVEELLTELGFNLDDVRNEAPSITADVPAELTIEEANVALKVLRDSKSRGVPA